MDLFTTCHYHSIGHMMKVNKTEIKNNVTNVRYHSDSYIYGMLTRFFGNMYTGKPIHVLNKPSNNTTLSFVSLSLPLSSVRSPSFLSLSLDRVVGNRHLIILPICLIPYTFIIVSSRLHIRCILITST